jgi:hypothetical protein
MIKPRSNLGLGAGRTCLLHLCKPLARQFVKCTARFLLFAGEYFLLGLMGIRAVTKRPARIVAEVTRLGKRHLGIYAEGKRFLYAGVAEVDAPVFICFFTSR